MVGTKYTSKETLEQLKKIAGLKESGAEATVSFVAGAAFERARMIEEREDEKRKPLGAIEQLAQVIEGLLPAQGGWWILEEQNELVIHTHVSSDPSRSSNGGEYHFYTCFAVIGDGILIYKDTSCELRIDRCGRDSYAAYTIPVIVGLDGLRRIAALVGLRAACKQFLARKMGFADLRAAVEAAA